MNTRSDIEIGNLDRRVTIQTTEVTKDLNSNEELINWIDYKTVWSKVDFPKGDEKFINDQETSIVKLVFTIRYDRVLLNKKNRVQYEGKGYDVESVTEIGRKDYLKINCIDLE